MKKLTANICSDAVLVVLIAVFGLTSGKIRESQKLEQKKSIETCRKNLSRLQRVLDQYQSYNSFDALPAKLSAVVPEFIEKLPRCPSSPDLDYSYQRYAEFNPCREFILSCPGHHDNLDPGYPKIFDAIKIAVDTPLELGKQFGAEYPGANIITYARKADPSVHPTFELKPMFRQGLRPITQGSDRD